MTGQLLNAASAEFNQLTETLENEQIDFVGNDKQVPVVTNSMNETNLAQNQFIII